MSKKLLFWEAMKAITENPKLILKSEAGELAFIDGRLRWPHEDFTIQHSETGKWDTLMYRYFTVVEPPKKLKEMLYGEAIYELFQVTQLTYSNLTSTLSGLSAARSNSTISKEEYIGLWTVTGVYEEDNKND